MPPPPPSFARAQTIAVVWTAIRQSPAGGTVPLVSKVVIVCPSTLVANWKAEFKK